MDWKKTIWKFLKAGLISAGVIITGSLLAGMQQFTPEPGTQTLIWQLGGAAAIGAVTAAFNWLKHKNDEVKN